MRSLVPIAAMFWLVITFPGGGERICVGMHLAEQLLFNVTSRPLQGFDIMPVVDEHGQQKRS
jgi:hypothetical protein